MQIFRKQEASPQIIFGIETFDEDMKIFAYQMSEKGSESPLSEICGLILFDQLFTFEPIHGHIVNGFVVYIHGHIELLHHFRGQVIRKGF